MRGLLACALALSCSVASLRTACAQSAAAAVESAEASDAPPPMPARVLLVPSTCGDFASASDLLLRQLRVELAGDGVEAVEIDRRDAGQPVPSLARLTIEPASCTREATVFVLGVDDAATRKSVRREVDLSDVGVSARTRALSMAAAELLRASWLELTLPTAPRTSAPVPAPVRDAVRVRLDAASPGLPATPRVSSATREPPLWSLQLPIAAESRLMPTGGLALYGGRLGVGAAVLLPGRTLSLRGRIDGGVALGSRASDWGDVDVQLVTGALSLTLSRGGSVSFELGPRVELGGGFAQGRRPSPEFGVGEGSAFVCVLGATAALRARWSPTVSASLEIDAGGAVAGLDARARVGGLELSAGGIVGPVLSLRMGLVFEPLATP